VIDVPGCTIYIPDATPDLRPEWHTFDVVNACSREACWDSVIPKCLHSRRTVETTSIEKANLLPSLEHNHTGISMLTPVAFPGKRIVGTCIASILNLPNS